MIFRPCQRTSKPGASLKSPIAAFVPFSGLVTVLLVITGAVPLSGLFAQQANGPQALERRIAQTVREAGTLESADVIELESPVTSSIRWIAPEGMTVRKGDRLCQIDVGPLESELVTQQVVVGQAKLATVQSKLALEAAQTEGVSQVRLYNLRLKAAESKLSTFTAGEGQLALEILEAQGNIRTAMAKLKAAETRLSLADPGDQVEHTTATAEVTAAAEALKLATARRKFLETHRKAERQAELELAVEEIRVERDLIKQQSQARLATAKAELESNEDNDARERAKLDRLQERLAGCTITAPRDGIVQYVRPNSRSASIQAGAAVRARQAMIRLIDPEQLQVRVAVHETRINRVRVGQPVRLQFDAASRTPVAGRVVSIAKTPEPTTFLSGDVKQYAVIVSVEKNDLTLRIGMTALAEINTGSR